MKKLIIIIVVALVLVGGVIAGIAIYNNNNRTDTPAAVESTGAAESYETIGPNGFFGDDDIIE